MIARPALRNTPTSGARATPAWGRVLLVAEDQVVLVIGNPEGLEGTVSNGLVAAIRKDLGLIQITAPISPGSSGSPVLNEEGRVVGVPVGISKKKVKI
jgi:S1-C subfamily serine protease